MARTITLQYAAQCRDCGAELSVGTRAKWYGRGRVYGIGCHAKPEGVTSGGVTWRATVRGVRAPSSDDGLKWWGGERVRASRCEDAPCCGCCE